MSLFECVPNVSAGRDPALIDACVRSAQACGARVLHRTSDAVHNRSVITLSGSYHELLEAALAIARESVQGIDLRAHRGIHPRIGALDVLPFVPLRGASMDQAVALAREAGARIWEQLRVPVYLYGEAASTPLRRELSAIRRGQFEGLDARFALPQWRPDFGEPAAHPSAGAIAVGARNLLVAWNVELASGDLALAKRIAQRIRERSGGLRSLRAIGLALSDRVVQVSMNVTEYRSTPLYRVVELIRRLAARDGVAVLRSEPIGLIPSEALESSARYYLGVQEHA